MAVIGNNVQTTTNSVSGGEAVMITGSDSYTPPGNEEIYEILVYHNNTSSSGVEISLGAYDVTGGDDGATLVAKEEFTCGSETNQWVTYTLTTPIPLSSGVEYSIAMSQDGTFNRGQATGDRSTDTTSGHPLGATWGEDSTQTQASSVYGNTQAVSSAAPTGNPFNTPFNRPFGGPI